MGLSVARICWQVLKNLPLGRDSIEIRIKNIVAIFVLSANIAGGGINKKLVRSTIIARQHKLPK
jgi:hypothetical protein